LAMLRDHFFMQDRDKTKIDDLTKIGYSAMRVLPVYNKQCMLNSKQIYILV
jgi:hypothetical protein